MTFRTTSRLWALLPAVLHTRDIEDSGELDALLQLLAWQTGRLEDTLDQLYRDWFIETCAEWAIPRLGDLVGYRAPEQPAASATGSRPWHVPSPRRDVADTIRNLRRKGTLPVLEQLAADVGGWSGRAVECHRLVAATTLISPGGRLSPGFVDLRNARALHRSGGPFGRTGRTVDVRRINSRRTPGRHNLGEVALFVWRLRSYPVRQFPAFRLDEGRRFTFSALGEDVALMTRGTTDGSGAVRDETDVAVPLTRQLLHGRLSALYGAERSVHVSVRRDGELYPVPAEQIVVADLGRWRRARPWQVAIDPERGRLSFPAGEDPPEDVLVTYHYGFPADVGGGAYIRPLTPVDDRLLLRVGNGGLPTLAAALAQWRMDGRRSAIIELAAGLYENHPEIAVEDGHDLEIRAAQEARVELRIVNRSASKADALIFRRTPAAAEGSAEDAAVADPPRLTLDGLIVYGRGIRVRGAFREIVVRHCTLVPRWSAIPEDDPLTYREPSLVVATDTGRVSIEHGISGPIIIEPRPAAGERGSDEPVELLIDDSILDATRLHAPAISDTDGQAANVLATIRRTTVLGALHLRWLTLAEDGLFAGPVSVTHRQFGCVRYSYLPPHSATPGRYRCQPDSTLAAAGPAEPAPRHAPPRLRPQFQSVRYGNPSYARLAATCPPEIRQGAEHGLELGVFRNLLEPYRHAALSARLDEYVPAGMNAAVINAT